MPETAAPPRPRRLVPGWLRNTIGLAVVAATFYFLINRLVHDWHKIPWHDLRFSVPMLVIAFALVFFAYIPLYGFTWKVIMAGMGERVSTWHAISILAVSQMGKYVPGKVWYALGRIYLAKRRGIPEAKTAVSAVIETGFALLAAALLFGLAVLFLPRTGIPSQVYLALLIVPVCLVLLYPPLFNRLIGFLLRKLRQPVFDVRLTWPRIIAILGLYIAMWLAQGVGCYALINSFYPLTPDKLPMLVGGYALSWILGFIVLISPAGLGVREGIFTFALGFVLPGPVAIIAALLSRIWITLGEGLTAVFFALFIRRRAPEEK
jgi:uncharacterized membrane protein YbhN (UPF0104 family)